MEGPGKAGRWPTADEGPEFVAYQGIDDTMVCEDVWEDPPSTSPSSASRPEIEECVLLHSLPSSAAVQVQGMPESHRHAHPNDDLLLDFVAAGVLPYTRGEGGEILFFFGKELSRGCTLSGKSKYVWSDFGGKREGLHETAGETASREFSEETLGLWGGMGSLDDRIAASISATTELIRHIPAPGSFVLKVTMHSVSALKSISFLKLFAARDASNQAFFGFATLILCVPVLSHGIP